MADFTAALDYLKLASQRGSRLGLERIRELCRLLGQPQNSLKTVHVSGTNGKGSFGAMLTPILTSAGYRTGWFSSPALTDITDYFRIDGRVVSRQRFAEVMESIIPLCESMADKPTEFEVLTAAAFELFRQEDCGIAVIECGMGGDTDSTNVIASPLLSVITNVQCDHGSFLGSTTAEIAVHKAGIIKSGRPVLFGGSDLDAAAVISRTAQALGSPMYAPDPSCISDFRFSISGMELTFTAAEETPLRLSVPLIGSYQRDNLLNVLAAVQLLRREGLSIPDTSITEGLSQAVWHGRFEILRREPLVIFDGAHNPDGMRSAADTLRTLLPGQKPVLVMGVMADKDYGLYADMLRDMAERIFTVTPDNPRALDCAVLAENFRQKGIPAEAHTDLTEGVRCAYSYAQERQLPLIALGSLYMYRQFTLAIQDKM